MLRPAPQRCLWFVRFFVCPRAVLVSRFAVRVRLLGMLLGFLVIAGFVVYGGEVMVFSGLGMRLGCLQMVLGRTVFSWHTDDSPSLFQIWCLLR